MRVRSILLAIALSTGLVTLAEAKAKPKARPVVVNNKRAAAASRKATKSAIKQHAAQVHKAPKFHKTAAVRPATKKPVKH